MEFLKLISLIIALSISTPQVFAQKNSPLIREKVFYDYELDYYPRISSRMLESGAVLSLQTEGNFQESLELIVNDIINTKLTIKRFPGRIMSRSGTFPGALNDCVFWIKIEIDKKGLLCQVNLYSETIENKIYLENLLQQRMNLCSINPAIRDGEKVRCRLFYVFQ